LSHLLLSRYVSVKRVRVVASSSSSVRRVRVLTPSDYISPCCIDDHRIFPIIYRYSEQIKDDRLDHY
jgi:hypothetical protein